MVLERDRAEARREPLVSRVERVDHEVLCHREVVALHHLNETSGLSLKAR